MQLIQKNHNLKIHLAVKLPSEGSATWCKGWRVAPLSVRDGDISEVTCEKCQLSMDYKDYLMRVTSHNTNKC
jgi:hypothetical protein